MTRNGVDGKLWTGVVGQNMESDYSKNGVDGKLWTGVVGQNMEGD